LQCGRQKRKTIMPASWIISGKKPGKKSASGKKQMA